MCTVHAGRVGSLRRNYRIARQDVQLGQTSRN